MSEHDCEQYTLRVTGGSFDGAHESVYACPECVTRQVEDIGQRFPDVHVVPLHWSRGVIA